MTHLARDLAIRRQPIDPTAFSSQTRAVLRVYPETRTRTRTRSVIVGEYGISSTPSLPSLIYTPADPATPSPRQPSAASYFSYPDVTVCLSPASPWPFPASASLFKTYARFFCRRPHPVCQFGCSLPPLHTAGTSTATFTSTRPTTTQDRQGHLEGPEGHDLAALPLPRRRCFLLSSLNPASFCMSAPVKHCLGSSS